jgi:hypothetical protein
VSAAVVAAIIARIAGTGSQALAVYDSRPTSPTYPYVVVYADGGVKSSDREADERISHAQGWQTTTVGVSAAQCRAALDRVNARLENWRPVVTGYTCSKVEHESSQPMKPDESLPDRTVHYVTDQWSTVADPA